jgi:hypothetical protein
MSADPYALLGLTPSANEDDIRAAYRRKAAQVHPDTQPAQRKEWAAERMRQLNAARELLLDPQRRAELDAQRREALARSRADGWAEERRRRSALRRFRQTLWRAGWLATGAGVCALAIFAPQFLQVFARVALLALNVIVAFGVVVLGPIAIALLLGWILLSFRG